MAKKSFRARAAAIGRSSVMGSGIDLVAGAGTAAVGGMLSDHFTFLRDKWYLLPLVTATGGHLLKRTRLGGKVGSAVVGASGAMGYYNKKLHDASVGAGGSETKGVQDVRGLEEDLAALRSLPETTGVQDVPLSGSSVTRMQVA